MRTIAVVNQKGGCGKTTTAINLAAVFAARGLRTLLVDMDPQSHCAAGLGVPEKGIEFSIGEAMLNAGNGRFDHTTLLWQVARNLDLAPSTMRLAALEAPGGGLHELPDKDRRLQAVLESLADNYDRCLIDCPPTIGLLTFNAMRAAREALIPVETGYFSLQGAQRQWETIQRVIRRIGRPIACHLLPTLYDPTSELARDILAMLRRRFAGQITPIVIHEHEELREAASMGQAVIEYAPASAARRDYQDLAEWLDAQRIEPAIEIEILSSADDELPRRSIVRTPPRPAIRPGEGNGGMQPTEADAVGGRAAELVERLRKLTRPSVESEGAEPAEPGTTGPAAPAVSAATIAEPAAPALPAISGSSPAPHAPEPLGSPIAAAPSTLPVDGDREPKLLTSLYGVRCISRGVLFIQPGGSDRTIYVGGDFNHYSPTAHPLRRNPQLGVDEAIVQIPPGRHRYRLLIDGRWQADPYNGEQEKDEHGQPVSIVTVPEGKMEP